jgi:2-dehydropantoate 2-reductase
MRFVIYGAGAIGGVIGSRLFQAGHETVLIARGEHLEAIRNRGLTLVTPTSSSNCPIPVVGHANEIQFRPDDVVLLTMKTPDTTGALNDLAAACDDNDIPIVCAQNGVENERLAARRFARVYAAMLWMPATFLNPGEVLCHSTPRNGVLDIGRFPKGVDELALAIAKSLDGSGLSSRAVPDIMRWKYSKLLTNIRSTVNALCGPGAENSDFADCVYKEAVACYAAAGIEFASASEDSQRIEAGGVSVAEIKGRPRTGGSIWQSLKRQTGSVETEFITGEIVMLGTLHGVDVRHNRAATICADRMARNRTTPGSLSMEELRRMAANDDIGGRHG